MTSSTDIVNQAIVLMGGNQELVRGGAPTFDNSAAGKAAQAYYTPAVQTVARQFGWDFARQIAVLVPSGNPPPIGWTNEYLYPLNGVQVTQLRPSLDPDPNNPLPMTWSSGNVTVGNAQKRVIWSNLDQAIAVFTGTPTEDTWDALFREAVVRFLASIFAMAIGGKPDTAQELLQSGAAFESLGETRDT